MESGEARPKGILRSLPTQVLAIIFVAAVGGAYPMITLFSAETTIAIIAGTLLSTANVLAGYAAIEYSIGRSYTTFLKVVMGGMGIRMAAMLGFFLLCIKVLQLPVIPLSSAMMSFYAVFLILEVLYIQTRFRTKNTTIDNVHSTS
jgi:hypothetical protein